MARLTRKQIEALSPDSPKKTLWDDNPKGLGVKVNKSGSKSYLLKYRNQYGQQRKLKLGSSNVLTLEQARNKAKEYLVDIANGSDPTIDRKENKQCPSMKDLLERYLEEHSKVNNKPHTYIGNESYVRRYLIPELGRYKVKEVHRKDIYALQQKLCKKSKPIANTAIAILSKVFNLAEIWGWRDDYTNPCRHVKKFPMKPKQRFLSKEEFNTLSKKLEFYEKAQLEPPSVIAALRLLMFTGCRLNEIVMLKWSYVDFDNACFRLPDSKTGAKTVYFSEVVANILRGIKKLPDNPYVITGQVAGNHLNNLEKPWRRIRKDCGLDDVRIHDLRHSFASMAAASGMSLPLIGAMLGHSQTQTTAQYVHLIGEPMRQAANEVNKTILEAMGNSGKV